MKYHLAQINVGRFRTPIDDPANAEFIANLDRVNALADEAPGFVWRLIGDGNSAIDIQAFDDPQIGINMSVWTDMESLAAFVYRDSGHREIMRRRSEWFEKMEFYMALWWIPAGHIPTIEEGKAKIELIAKLGSTPDAFLFNKPFPAPSGQPVETILDQCA